MTTTLSTAGLGASLTSALAQAGLVGQLVEAPALPAALGQPLLVIRMPLRAGAGVEVTVVVADRSSDQSADQLVQDLAQATAGVLEDLVDGDASLEVADALDPVLASFTAPVQAVLVQQPGGSAGAVLFALDRRAGNALGDGNGDAGDAAGARAPLGRVGMPVLPPVGGSGHATLALLRDVQLDVSVELGRTEMTVADVLELSVGSVVELDRAARAPVDIRVNGTLLARGEVVVVDDEYAVRVTEIIDPVA